MGQRLDTRGQHNAVSGAATPDLNSVEAGQPHQPQPTLIQHQKRKTDWLVPLVVLACIMLFFLLALLVFDSLVSWRIDERLRYSQDQQPPRFSNCRPCDLDEPESSDSNCCKLGTDLLSYIQKVGYFNSYCFHILSVTFN